MTPADFNAVMPIGEPMSSQAVLRAMEARLNRPLVIGQVVHFLREAAPHIKGGQYTTRWREWMRVADIPDAVTTRTQYPCPVRHEMREVPLTTKSSGSVMVRVTLPRESWVTA